MEIPIAHSLSGPRPDVERSRSIFALKSAESELSFTGTVKQFYSGKGDGGRVEVLETEHGTSSGFDATVVLFYQIVQILRRPQLRAFGQMSAFCISCTVRCETAYPSRGLYGAHDLDV
jgi:hypothetical protein